MDRLTDEQQTVLNHVLQGHNAFISGMAGTGKSFLVKKIYRSLKQDGKNVVIVCSSGIAGTVYNELNTYVPTVHSFYGLRTADMPCDMLINRALEDNLCAKRVRDVDCVIFDEASMTSRRMFEIANRMHIKAGEEAGQIIAFNRAQVVIVGEFLQLRPVPGVLDNGEFMFKSPLFDRIITHRFELTVIKRQVDNQNQFIDCLKDVRQGQCSEASLQFLRSLQRELQSEMKEVATHIFFRKIPAQVYNMIRLQELPGNEDHFNATDVGATGGMNCPAEKVVTVKPFAKVMLLWNKTDRLRNGTMGTYISRDGDDHIIVKFEGVGNISVKRETWQRRSSSGDIVGQRTQFPIMLCYATTCHKAQGLTLPAAVVHCSREFVPGLMYVALTRVKKSECLQIIDFKKRQILIPDKDSLHVCDKNSLEKEENHTCCRNRHLTNEELHVSESCETDAMPDDYPLDNITEQARRVMASYFERDDPDELYIDIATVYEVLSSEALSEFVRMPPLDFNVRIMLEDMMIDKPQCEHAENKNAVIEELLSDQESDDIGNMGKILWCRVCKMTIEESLMDVTEISLTPKQWSLDTKKLYLHITRSKDFGHLFNLFFGVNKLSGMQCAIAAELMHTVYKKVVNAIANKVRRVEMESPVHIDIKEMPSEGLAKVRYVGAWAVAKVLHKKMTFVKKNVSTSSRKTMQSVQEALEFCKVIEEYLIGNREDLQDNSRYKKTLEITENRQYRSGGLLHIEDVVYEFFIELEILRVENLNHDKLRSLKERLVDDALKAVLGNSILLNKWFKCFPDEYSNQELIKQLFTLIVTKYMKAGAGQYIRDYRLAYRLKKNAEHRKNVLQRQKTLEEKKAAVPFGDIVNDTSHQKLASHHRMVAYITKYGVGAFMKYFKKDELVQLCRAYGFESAKNSMNKADLSQQLIPLIQQSQCVTYPYFLDNLKADVNIDNENERIYMIISRTNSRRA